VKYAGGWGPKVTTPAQEYTDNNGRLDKLNGLCGTLSWDRLVKPKYQARIKSSGWGLKVVKEIVGYEGSEAGSAYEALALADLQRLDTARVAGLIAMWNSLLPAARRVVNNHFTESSYRKRPIGRTEDGRWVGAGNKSPLLNARELNEAYNVYINTVQGVLDSLANSLSGNREYIESAKKNGWLLAGSYYFQLANMNRTAAAISKDSGVIEAEPPGSIEDNSLIKDMIAEYAMRQDRVDKLTALVTGDRLGRYIDDASPINQIIESQQTQLTWLPKMGNILRAKHISVKNLMKESGNRLKKALAWVVNKIWKGVLTLINLAIDLLTEFVNKTVVLGMLPAVWVYQLG